MNTTQLDPIAVATVAGQRVVPAQLHLLEPLPGLPGRTEYTLQALDDIGVLFAIRSDLNDGPQVRLFLVSPHMFFPTYSPRLPQNVLDTTASEERVLFVVVRPADHDGQVPTANLLAPLVVDAASGRAVQVVLDEDLPLRAPVG